MIRYQSIKMLEELTLQERQSEKEKPECTKKGRFPILDLQRSAQ